MKKYIYISLFFLLFSCEDFLDKEPLGRATEGTFNDGFNELQVSLNAVYNTLTRENFQKAMWLFGEGCADDVVVISSIEPSDEDARLCTYRFDSRNVWIERHWEENYLGIFRANRVINSIRENSADLIAQLGDGNRDDLVALQQMAGQAKFLRAMFYFNLVRTYGEIPIKDEVFVVQGSKDNFINPKSRIDEVYDYIEKDLREAILSLNNEYDNNGTEQGKVERGAALGLLIKVLANRAIPGIGDARYAEMVKLGAFLIEGIPSNFTNEEILNFESLYGGDVDEIARMRSEMAMTFRAAESVIEPYSQEEFLQSNIESPSGNYAVSFSYNLIWTKAGEFQPGSLFEISHYTPDETDNVTITTKVFDQLASNSGGAVFIQPSNSLLAQEVATNDPRLVFSTINHAQLLPDGTTSSTAIEPTGQGVTKWYTSNFERPSTGRNIPLLRMGEIYLFYAEALNEMNNPVKAVELVNTLRSRRVRGLARILDAEPNNYTETRSLIFQDKRAEMVFEFDRFYEIKRQGNFRKSMIEYNSSIGIDVRYTKVYENLIGEVFPIPQQEIDLSSGIVTQNPGY